MVGKIRYTETVVAALVGKTILDAPTHCLNLRKTIEEVERAQRELPSDSDWQAPLHVVRAAFVEMLAAQVTLAGIPTPKD